MGSAQAPPWVGYLPAVLLSAIALLLTLLGSWLLATQSHQAGLLASSQVVWLAVVLGVGVTASILARRLRAQRRRSERQRELLAVTLASIGDGVVVTDAQGCVTFLNAEAERLTGWMNRDTEGLPVAAVFRIVSEQAHELPVSLANTDLPPGAMGGANAQSVLMAKDGREIPIALNRATIRGEDGTIQGEVLVFRDVSEQRQVEEKVRASEELLRQAARVSGVVIMDHDHRTNTIHWLSRLGEIRGFGPEEPANLAAFLERIHPDDRQKVAEAIRHGHDPSGDSLHAFDCRVVWPDGTVRWITQRGQTFFQGEGSARRSVRTVGVVVDITERKQAEEELRASEELFRAFFNNAAVGTSLVEPNGRFVQVNDRYCEISGYSRQELLTMTPADLLHPDDRPHEEERLKRFFKGQVPSYDNELRRVRKDGTVIWILVNASMIHGADGRLMLAAAMIQDITQRKTAEEALAAARQSAEQAKAAAEAANRAKSQFLAHMSHELRTPMNSILGMTELALQESLSPLVRDYLHTVKDSAESLLVLINELLDLSRIEAGVLLLEPSPFSIRSLLDDTLKAVSLRASEKSLELACHVAPEVPDRLIGDSPRLRQILTNLLGNAIKFTERGEVGVHVDLEEERPEEVCLRFAVSDTGIGIAPEHQQRIFAPFVQADPSMTRRFRGCGLGLSIVSRLVNMFGGQVELKSEAGQGSTFSFTVTLRRQGSPEPADPQRLVSGQAKDTAVALCEEQTPSTCAPKTKASCRLRVLLAEDSPANQKLAVHILGRRGHVVEVARNGQEAIERLRRGRFDVVLMDVQMPVMDGFQATNEIRKMKPSDQTHVPIIAMTAHALKGDREQCLSAGMDAYISKPINGQKLIALVEQLASHSSMESITRSPDSCDGADWAWTPVEEQPRDGPPPRETGEAVEFDLDEAVRRCFGKHHVFQDMVACFFSEVDPLVEQMYSSLSQGNTEEAYRAAHRLKNTVVYLGANRAAEATEEVERFCRTDDLAAATRAVGELVEQLATLKRILAEYYPKAT